MEWESFVEKYKPIINPVEDNAPIDGFMFETYEPDIGALKAKADASAVNGKNGYHVWTVVDGEGRKLYLINGWHFINRLGYIYTKVAWKEGDEIEVEI